MTEIETKALDPVCGMTVDPNRAAGSYEYQGKTYYFCSTHCLHRFRENPQAFLQPKPVTISRDSASRRAG